MSSTPNSSPSESCALRTSSAASACWRAPIAASALSPASGPSTRTLSTSSSARSPKAHVSRAAGSGSTEMDAMDFDHWLKAYQQAWQGRDAAAAAALFSADAEYYWTPLDPPALGPAGVAAAWEGAVSQQRDITFRYEVLAVTATTGIAKWRADFTRLPTQGKVRIEGVLTAEFA